MRPWEIVDHELVPDDEGTIYLLARGSEYSIHVDGRELMSNRQHGSESALADMACDRLEDLAGARILVGGLGMGFTLAAVLARIGSTGNATVAELMPAVVRWNRERCGRAAGYPLRDPRVALHIGDVIDLVEHVSDTWSAILLDIDNGPAALTRPGNGWLYTRQGLKAIHGALITGGVVGIWSAADDDGLTARLRKAGFEVEVLHFTEEDRPTYDDSGTHVLWMARRA